MFGAAPHFLLEHPYFPPPRVALKERNGVVPESDSPVKRPGRKAARVLCSEGEEEEDGACTPPRGQVGPVALPISSGGSRSSHRPTGLMAAAAQETLDPCLGLEGFRLCAEQAGPGSELCLCPVTWAGS